MEGIAGVVDSSHTSPAGRNYAAAREQMIAETSAARLLAAGVRHSGSMRTVCVRFVSLWKSATAMTRVWSRRRSSMLVE